MASDENEEGMMWTELESTVLSEHRYSKVYSTCLFHANKMVFGKVFLKSSSCDKSQIWS